MIWNKVTFLATLALAFQLTLAAPLELVAVDSSESSITISWHYNQSLYGTPEHYSLRLDATELQFLPSTERVKVLRTLSPCHAYNLTLTAVFPATSLSSEPKTITTLQQAPEAVKSLRAAEGNLSWDAPGNGECAKSYKVCAQAMAPHAKPTCRSVPKSPVSLSEYEGCSSVLFQVSGEAEDKTSGNPVSVAVETPFKAPQNPTSLNITSEGDTARLDWEIPLHYSCVQSIDVSYGSVSQPGEQKTIVIRNPVRQRHQNVVVYNLTACSDYEFAVSHTSSQGERVKPVKATTTSQDIKPEALKGLAAAQDPKSAGVKISWSPLTQSGCLGGVNVCLINERRKMCKDQKDATISSLNFEDVSGCEKFTVVAKAFSSHSKYEGPASSINITTPEQVPGPVSNLKISGQTTSSLKVTFDAPEVSPLCVAGYSVTSMELPKPGTPAGGLMLQGQETVLNNLKSCTDYKVSVAAVSPSQEMGEAQTVTGSTLVNGRPEPVDDLRVTDVGHFALELTWNTTTARSCAEYYHMNYEYNNHYSKTFTFKNEGQKTMVQKVDELRECAYYLLNVWVESHGKTSSILGTNGKTKCSY